MRPLLKLTALPLLLMVIGTSNEAWCAAQVSVKEAKASSASPLKTPALMEEDPYESFNRHIFSFNQTLDQWLLKPVAQAYKAVLPSEVRKRVGFVFSNLALVPTAANDLLQGKLTDSFESLARFSVNSTVGLLGLFDPAEKLFPEHKNDFGVTLATWSEKKQSPYLILPILGPSTFRDALGRVVDMKTFSIQGHLHSVRFRNGLYLLNMVNFRATLIDLDNVAHEASFDRYVFDRDAYLQTRHTAISGSAVDTYVPDESTPGSAPKTKTASSAPETTYVPEEPPAKP